MPINKDDKWADEHVELIFLHDLSNSILKQEINSDKVYEILLNGINAIIPVKLSFLLIRDKDMHNLELRSIFMGDKTTLNPDNPNIEAEKYLARWAFQIKETILLNNKLIDISITDPFNQDLQSSTNSYLFCPNIYKGDVLGVIGLVNKKSGNFNQRDKFLVESASSLLTLHTLINEKNMTSQDAGVIRDVPSGFISINSEGKVFMVNPRASEILEISDNITGKYFFEVLPFDKDLFKSITEGLKSQKTEFRMFSTLTLASKKRIGYSTFILTGESNKPQGLGIIFQDMTKKK